MESLLEVLLKQVLSGIQGEATEACLGLLSSMCRNNFSVQTHIKHKEDSKVLLFSLHLKKIFFFFTLLCSVGIDGDFLYQYHSDNLWSLSINIEIYCNILKDI